MSHPGRLEGKIAVITSAGLGLGEGIARKFVHEGARVLIFELIEANGESLAAGPRRHGRRFHRRCDQGNGLDGGVEGMLGEAQGLRCRGE